MLNQFNRILLTQPRKIFLFDALGAIVSLLLLLGLVAGFDNFFGISKPVLYKLAFIPLLFALYSMSCYFINPKQWQVNLKIIAIANILYVCITLGLAFYYFGTISVLGIVYFMAEIVVLILLSRFEWRLANEKY